MDLTILKSEVEIFQKDFEKEYNDIKKDFQDFINLYPFNDHPERINSLDPEDIFNPGNPSFLYYIEHRLRDFGNIRVGQSNFAYNARDQIDDFKMLLKTVIDDSISIADKVDAPWDKIKYWGGDRHIAKKIIFCYNTDKVMPIYNTSDLEEYAALINKNFDSQENNFGKDYDDLTLGERFEYLNEVILKFKTENITEMDNVSFMHFLYTHYPTKRMVESSNINPFKWCFTVNMELNPDFKDKNQITWNSPTELKKEDIILFYCGKPLRSISDIFIAQNDPYHKKSMKENWKTPAVDVLKKIVLKNPIEWNELKMNPILKDWAAVKMNFGKSHFKISEKEGIELKRLILEKNPVLESDILSLENELTIMNDLKIWKITPGDFEKRQKIWSILKERGYIGVGSFVCDQFIRKDYSTFKSYEEVVKSLKKCSNQPLVGISAGMIWNFGNIMQKGDIIVANSGIKGILGIGLIESDYINPIKSKKLNLDEDEEFFHFRKVKWLIKDEIEFNSQIFDRKTITPIYSDKWQKIKEAYVKKDSEYEDIFRKIENYKSYTKIKTKNDEIDISEEYHSFNEYLNHENFIYTPEMIENFLLSLKVKPFVILTGNSGTGKTKIAQLFAEYLQNKNKGEFLIIPVGANWTENRHLMGFYNVITRDYQSTPALDLIIKARNDISNPYFLILDEMNLSHVERYFSDFLSAIESGKEISLYSTENAQKIKNKNIPEKIKIPHNLFVVGTVNVDETTYMFSPKVLDRANTIEFKTYPARDYIMSEIEHKVPEGNIDYLENPLSNLKIRNYKINKLKDQLTHVKINDNNNLWEVLALEIHSFQEALSEAGFDFGFRVIDEVMRFMYATWLYEDSPDEWKNWTRYFDAQIMQKMLPKIHGSQQELSQVLENLFELCYSGESINKIWYSANLEEYEIKYPSSAKKLQKMGKKLQEKRFVSFTD